MVILKKSVVQTKFDIYIFIFVIILNFNYLHKYL